MKAFFLIFISLLNSTLINADEIKCSGYAGPSASSSLENLVTDCELHKTLASDPTVQNEHRKEIYRKLANKLSTQIKQNSENISMLTSFYNANGQDLMMNSKEIANSCRLDSIKSVENCGGKKTGPLQNFKLELLKESLPKNSGTPFSNDQSLYGIMAGKFYSDLGMSDNEKNLQCPLIESSGSFMLKSQLDDFSADYIIERLTKSNEISEIFEQFPQLKIIKSTNDSDFINDFINYAKNKPANQKSKEYITKFFFDSKNQQKLAPTLASQCEKITNNINEFLCSDLTELGSLDDKASKNLFNKLNVTEPMDDQYEVDFSKPLILTAYGLQCLAKEKKLSNMNKDKKENEQSVDKWFADFTINLREEDSIENSQKTVDNFCSIYTCKDEKAQIQNSCKNGGPITSSELKKVYGCDLVPISDACNSPALKNISYIESLEKIKSASKDQVVSSTTTANGSTTSSSNNPSSEKVSSGRLPNFAENYLGIEGSLKALGKPATAYMISEKKEEFKERKLESKDPVYSTPAVTASMNAQKNQVQNSAVAADNSIRPTYTPTTSSTTSIRPTISSSSVTTDSKISSTTSTKAKTLKPVESESSSESSRLRDEMEKMIADIKSTKKEISDVQQTIDSPNASASTALGSSSKASSGTSYSAANRIEQERLKRLEQSLSEKEQRLEDYRRQLDNRNYAQGSSSSNSESSAGRAPSNGGSGGGGGMSGGGSGGSGSAVKLSAGGNAKADAKSQANTAALIQSGVESSTLSVDELTHLSADSLKKLGIDSSRPFTLKVTIESQTYQVPVKTFSYKGSNILGPITDPKNKELNDILLKSPLFKQYLEYKFEKENQ